MNPKEKTKDTLESAPAEKNISSEQLIENENPQPELASGKVEKMLEEAPGETMIESSYTSTGSGQSPSNHTFPGKDLGIAGLIVSFLFAPIGIILSAMSLSKSNKVRHENTPALVGLILGVIFTIFWCSIIVFIVLSFSDLHQRCEQLGPGVHQDGDSTITCGNSYVDNNVSED